MHLKRILKAIFRIRNIALLSGVMILTYLTEYLPFALVGVAAYLFFVLQTLNDKALDRNDLENEKIDNLLELDVECNDLYYEARKVIDKQYLKKMEETHQDKDELMELFHNDQDNYIKQKVIEQVLKLVMAYIKLLSEFGQRRNEMALFNTSQLVESINENERRLKHLKDNQAIDDMQRAIEMDRRVLAGIEQEKKELERISVRLTYIESALKTFKHQIISSENTDEMMTTEIDNIINEAAALDNVLSSRRNEKLKL